MAHRIGHGFASSLSEGWWMFYATFWALVLGFALSGAVQAFVSRSQMRTALGDHRPITLARASFFGVVSSSCSYAASALAKESVRARRRLHCVDGVHDRLDEPGGRTRHRVVAVAGLAVSAAEFVGGAIMIVLLGIALPRAIPGRWIDEARDRLARDGEPSADVAAPGAWQHRMRSRTGWSQASGYTISDLTMLRKELVAGFLVAGFASVLAYTTVLNIIAAVGFGVLYWLYRSHRSAAQVDNPYAKDAMCGMQVEKANAPATAVVDALTFYFCSDGCRAAFVARRAAAGQGSES